jgi:hypothetical protein
MRATRLNRCALTGANRNQLLTVQLTAVGVPWSLKGVAIAVLMTILAATGWLSAHQRERMACPYQRFLIIGL